MAAGFAWLAAGRFPALPPPMNFGGEKGGESFFLLSSWDVQAVRRGCHVLFLHLAGCERCMLLLTSSPAVQKLLGNRAGNARLQAAATPPTPSSYAVGGERVRCGLRANALSAACGTFPEEFGKQAARGSPAHRAGEFLVEVSRIRRKAVLLFAQPGIRLSAARLARAGMRPVSGQAVQAFVRSVDDSTKHSQWKR